MAQASQTPMNMPPATSPKAARASHGVLGGGGE